MFWVYPEWRVFPKYWAIPDILGYLISDDWIRSGIKKKLIAGVYQVPIGKFVSVGNWQDHWQYKITLYVTFCWGTVPRFSFILMWIFSMWWDIPQNEKKIFKCAWRHFVCDWSLSPTVAGTPYLLALRHHSSGTSQLFGRGNFFVKVCNFLTGMGDPA